MTALTIYIYSKANIDFDKLNFFPGVLISLSLVAATLMDISIVYFIFRL